MNHAQPPTFSISVTRANQLVLNKHWSLFAAMAKKRTQNGQSRKRIRKRLGCAGLVVVGILVGLGVPSTVAVYQSEFRESRKATATEYETVTIEEILANPGRYIDSLVEVSDGEVWLASYSNNDVPFLYRVLNADSEQSSFLNNLQLIIEARKSKGNLPMKTLGCNFHSDLNSAEYEHIGPFLEREPYRGQLVVRGIVKTGGGAIGINIYGHSLDVERDGMTQSYNLSDLYLP